MRIVLLALLIFFVNPVWAKWTRISESSKFVLYLDRATIQKKDSHRTVWVLHDLKKQDPEGERSIRLLHEYDCQGGRIRLLATSTHSGQMTKGSVLSKIDTPNSEWVSIPRRSCHWGSFKFVCVK